MKVDKVQLKVHNTHKNIFLMNQVMFLDLRVYFKFPVKYSPTLHVEPKYASLEKESIEN